MDVQEDTNLDEYEDISGMVLFSYRKYQKYIPIIFIYTLKYVVIISTLLYTIKSVVCYYN